MFQEWQSIGEFRNHGDIDALRRQHQAANGWVARHFGCALVATAVLIMLERQYAFNELLGVLGVYIVISLICAVIESLLAQRIAWFAESCLKSVKMKISEDE
jgi:hypothetical protein